MLSTTINFIKEQKEELKKNGYWKIYTKCKHCGTHFIFINDDLTTKKVCICQSNAWSIFNILEL